MALTTLPSGTVTFLFTDIEGSTKLAQEYPDQMPALLERHNEILSQSIETNQGYVFLVAGDAFCAAFHNALDAVQAALSAQRGLSSEPWVEGGPIRVRMGLHTGPAQLTGDKGYSGYTTLAAAQRIMSAGHGGQTLLSGSTRELVFNTLPSGGELYDLGEKRLKDLLHPEHLYQLNIDGLPTTFPPLKTLETVQNNLPIQLTSFVGRENEIAELKEELETRRLITLSGSGGTGKTRLSLQVGAEILERFHQGVWFIELAPITDPEFIPQAILTEIGVSEQQGRQPIDILKEYLRSKEALLILDNCEHLITACAQLTNTLLNAAPGLKILATSREALGVKGELSYPVPSLSLPDLKKLPGIEPLSQVEAIRLFIDRARLADPHFVFDQISAPFVAQICYRLDGIPLAIELAAARVKVLSVEQVSNRLDDRFRLLTGGARTALPRQQTLRALIDWSYDLLTDPERMLLQRLSVFSGSWSLEAAEEVCSGDGIDSYDVLDLLSQLVNKSLVVVVENPQIGEIRYRMLETIRQYGREKLLETASGGSVRDKHLDYYLELVKRAEQEFYGPRDLAWLVIFDAEWENLRSAVEWSIETHPVDGLELVNGLGRYIEDNWHVSDLENWLSQLVRDPHNTGKTATRARGLMGWALAIAIGPRQEDLSVSRATIDEAIVIYTALQDTNGLSDAMREKGVLYAWMGDPSRGISLLEEALRLARQADNKPAIALTLYALGFAPHSHETLRKLAYLQESLALYREMGYAGGMIEALKQLGAIELRQGNFEAAHKWLDEALAIIQEHAAILGSSKTVSYDVGDLAFYEGNYELAQTYYQDCLIWADRVGSTISIGYAKVRLGYLYLRLGDQNSAALSFHEALIIFQTVGNTHGTTFTLEGIASLAVIEGQLKKAATLYAFADHQYEEILGPRPPAEQEAVDKDMAVIHSHFGEAEFAALTRQGQSMTVEEAVQLGLS